MTSQLLDHLLDWVVSFILISRETIGYNALSCSYLSWKYRNVTWVYKFNYKDEVVINEDEMNTHSFDFIDFLTIEFVIKPKEEK